MNIPSVFQKIYIPITVHYIPILSAFQFTDLNTIVVGSLEVKLPTYGQMEQQRWRSQRRERQKIREEKGGRKKIKVVFGRVEK